ncbi:uncharacterized protein LOC141533142 isoform X1 [Cotesia typhae]|uniref:uncharacterized protein LOC141533142 isoform X1 n=1 Tax=Cotesia typhae TaxID=2053667 RepID=UPI003D69B300
MSWVLRIMHTLNRSSTLTTEKTPGCGLPNNNIIMSSPELYKAPAIESEKVYFKCEGSNIEWRRSLKRIDTRDLKDDVTQPPGTSQRILPVKLQLAIATGWWRWKQELIFKSSSSTCFL